MFYAGDRLLNSGKTRSFEYGFCLAAEYLGVAGNEPTGYPKRRRRHFVRYPGSRKAPGNSQAKIKFDGQGADSGIIAGSREEQ